MSNHVIIMGCGRSGTSIFGEFFEHLEEYTYFSEPPFDDLIELDYSRPIAAKVPRESKQFSPDDGLSVSVSKLKEVVPEPRSIFWIVRHPLDAICSLKVGIAKNWGHHPRPKNWEAWLEKPLVEQCAYHWNYINSIGYEKIQNHVQTVRFENMILDPLTFAQNICLLGKIDIESNFDNISAWCNRVQNSNNNQFKEAKTSQAYSTKDHSVRVERWKENLSDKEIEMIRPLVLETANKFGYTF